MSIINLLWCTEKARIECIVPSWNELHHNPESLYLLLIFGETVLAGLTSLYKLRGRRVFKILFSINVTPMGTTRRTRASCTDIEKKPLPTSKVCLWTRRGEHHKTQCKQHSLQVKRLQNSRAFLFIESLPPTRREILFRILCVFHAGPVRKIESAKAKNNYVSSLGKMLRPFTRVVDPRRPDDMYLLRKENHKWWQVLVSFSLSCTNCRSFWTQARD